MKSPCGMTRHRLGRSMAYLEIIRFRFRASIVLPCRPGGSNGNMRNRQGRLLTRGPTTRRVTYAEPDERIPIHEGYKAGSQIGHCHVHCQDPEIGKARGSVTDIHEHDRTANV